ncbi:MAG: glycosyltransferase family 2 protein [Psychroflexus sp.]|nr:glycosyltransferase family 2 protein [Psychroflexus sp.]MDN6309702.1 glycosyltransferase family 2 protein [Psychroflexus sp.]
MLKFSVVIPVYNKAEFLENTLDSVFSQTYPHFEVIAVNDGSTDRSLRILERYKSKGLRIINQANKGASVARNNGIDHAQNAYIALIDADDIWSANHLEEHANSIKRFPDQVIYTNHYSIKWSSNTIKPAEFNLNETDQSIRCISNYFEASLKDNLIWTSAVCFKRSTFNNLGHFNSIYKTGQDLDLWIRFALEFPIVYNPNTTMIYHKGIINSLSKNEYNEVRYQLFSSYLKEEHQNKDLSLYLDQKRYGLALRTKAKDNIKLFKKTLLLIDTDRLSFKQKFLLNLPVFILNPLHKLRDFLMQKEWFLKLTR